MNSTEARPIIVKALERVQGRAPSLPEIYIVQAVARYDGGYGNFRSPPHGPEGPTSNNWGAVQHPDLVKFRIWRGNDNPKRDDPEVKQLLSTPAPASPHPTEWFYASDFLPPSRGGKGWFWGPYRVYTDPIEGAAHVVRLLEKMGVLEVGRKGGTWEDVARKMHEQRYFVGYGNDEDAIRVYAKNMHEGGTTFAKLFNETDPLDPKAPAAPPVTVEPSDSSSDSELCILRLGSFGNAVRLWQRLLNNVADRGGIILDVDGDFGPITQATTRHWQSRRRLVVDGVVGPISWGRMP